MDEIPDIPLGSLNKKNDEKMVTSDGLYPEYYYSEVVAREEVKDQEWLENFWKIKNELTDQIKLLNSNLKNILIIEDDDFIARDYGLALRAEGFYIIYVTGPDDALRLLKMVGDKFCALIIDIRMEYGEFLSAFETVYGQKTGILLCNELLDLSSNSTCIALTNSNDALDEAWFVARERCKFCKKINYSPNKFAKYVRSIIMKDFSKIKTFIIHGHDKKAALELKNYLQNRLGFSEPTILAEKASGGMTIIEKFEKHANEADLVFALFTPDDFVKDDNARARQNVIFEFGYFMGLMGRQSGKVIMLYKNEVEIPSDISGVVYINITNGIEASGESIRRELEALF